MMPAKLVRLSPPMPMTEEYYAGTNGGVDAVLTYRQRPRIDDALGVVVDRFKDNGLDYRRLRGSVKLSADGYEVRLFIPNLREKQADELPECTPEMADRAMRECTEQRLECALRFAQGVHQTPLLHDLVRLRRVADTWPMLSAKDRSILFTSTGWLLQRLASASVSVATHERTAS